MYISEIYYTIYEQVCQNGNVHTKRTSVHVERCEGHSLEEYRPHDRQEPELPKLWPLSKGGED
jgi:hypothetical protein